MESVLRWAIGQLKHLGLKMTKFDASKVTCKGLSQPVSSDCISTLNTMPATEQLQRFGPRDTPNVDVRLPKEIQATRK